MGIFVRPGVATPLRGRLPVLQLLADATDETLGREEVEGRGDVEGLEAHVDQTGDRGGAVVGVQRGEHEVTGERGLDGDAARLDVPNLTDHDDVRILPQERLERLGEGHADLGPHEHLIDAVDVVLDRVLGGHDVRPRSC